MRLNNRQSVQEVIDQVKSAADIEELKAFISENANADEDTVAYLIACREALRIYEQGFFRRWSTPFLQGKLEACQQGNARYAGIYEAEIRQRKITKT